MDTVARWARDSGADRLRLSVMPDNERAKTLYRHTDFHQADELGDLLPDGVSREQVMLRPL
ncbi:hypothetical protein ABZ403_21605 [Micromonospora zamorensis]|uniref:GNAT family N-acetyltransferase n=1 Tax=Micromonospora zamorensis TaxID=709883 RepID=UPI0033EC828F